MSPIDGVMAMVAVGRAAQRPQAVLVRSALVRRVETTLVLGAWVNATQAWVEEAWWLWTSCSGTGDTLPMHRYDKLRNARAVQGEVKGSVSATRRLNLRLWEGYEEGVPVPCQARRRRRPRGWKDGKPQRAMLEGAHTGGQAPVSEGVACPFAFASSALGDGRAGGAEEACELRRPVERRLSPFHVPEESLPLAFCHHASARLPGYQPIIAAGLNAQMDAAPGRLTPSE